MASIRRATAVAEAQVAEAEANLAYARTQLAYARIHAPIAGIVASVSTQEGETVAVGWVAYAEPDAMNSIESPTDKRV